MIFWNVRWGSISLSTTIFYIAILVWNGWTIIIVWLISKEMCHHASQFANVLNSFQLWFPCFMCSANCIIIFTQCQRNSPILISVIITLFWILVINFFFWIWIRMRVFRTVVTWYFKGVTYYMYSTIRTNGKGEILAFLYLPKTDQIRPAKVFSYCRWPYCLTMKW